MKKITTLLFALIITASAFAQFPVGRMTINFKDASRTGGSAGGATVTVPNGGTGRSVGANLFYPSIISGTNTAVANGQFPVVVIGHGFVMAASDYTNVANRLASLGYIVALARTENEGPIPIPAPNHVEFANDLKYLAGAVQTLNTTTITSLTSFNGKVTNKSALSGHSMGAGCSYIGAQNNTTITCLFNFAAAYSNTASATNSSNGGANLVTVPSLVISGQLDNVADTLVQNAHYNATASAKKFQVIIKGVAHCDFGNGTSGTCTIGQPACSGAGCNAILFERYMTYVEPFLANQLKNDCAEGNRFMDSLNSNSSNRVGRKITGTLACTTVLETELDNIAYLAIYPNPSQSIVNIDMNLVKNMDTKISITNQLGQIVFSEIKSSESQQLKMPINCENWNSGIYFITINAGEKSVIQKFIKL